MSETRFGIATPYEKYLSERIDRLEEEADEAKAEIERLQGVIDSKLTSPPTTDGQVWYVEHMFTPHELEGGQFEILKDFDYAGTIVRLSARSRRDLETLAWRVGYVFESMRRKMARGEL